MKRYLITGASRGIGRAIAIKLAAPDVTLLLHGRDRLALDETGRLLASSGASAIPLVHDLSDQRAIENLIAEVGSEPIDLLVNNAGIAIVKPFAEITRLEWERIFAVNVTAPFRLMQHFAPRMPSGSGIVNILSVAAKTAFPNWSAYCASKFALDGLSAAIREELRSRTIRVINIYPGATNTEIWRDVAGDWPREKMMSPAAVAEAVAAAVSQPPEIAFENISLSGTHRAL